MSKKAEIPVIWLVIHNGSPEQHFQAVLWIRKAKNLHQQETQIKLTERACQWAGEDP